VGLSAEPYPGNTPFTKEAELENGQTSAWGRALAALGFKVDRGIASANEVRGRSGGGSSDRKQPSEKQVEFFESLVLDFAPPAAVEGILVYAKAELTGGKGGTMSKAIDGLKDKETRTEIAERLTKAAEAHKANVDAEVTEAAGAKAAERDAANG
jgi:hypothetical protein